MPEVQVKSVYPLVRDADQFGHRLVASIRLNVAGVSIIGLGLTLHREGFLFFRQAIGTRPGGQPIGARISAHQTALDAIDAIYAFAEAEGLTFLPPKVVPKFSPHEPKPTSEPEPEPADDASGLMKTLARHPAR